MIFLDYLKEMITKKPKKNEEKKQEAEASALLAFERGQSMYYQDMMRKYC